MKILETNRLLLRHQDLGDLDSLYALYCDPEVIKYIPDAPRSYEETQELLEWHQHGHPRFPELGLWATIYKPTGAFIGRCGLLPWTIEERQEVEVAFALARAYWGQGLATEAAQGIVHYAYETLHLTRLVCLISYGNQASIRVAEKIGMRLEKETEDEIGPFMLYSMSKD
jgi:RimJ/RimL family protein N-acetyltransferase